MIPDDVTVVTMRQLKQSPGAVVDKALAVRRPIQITRHGQRTGVYVQAETRGEPMDEVPGSALNAMSKASQFVRAETEAWQADIQNAEVDETAIDPWAA